MKKSICIIAAAALLAACHGKKTAGSEFGPGEYLHEEGKYVDLGTINEIDGKVEFTIIYKNETPDTLFPVKAGASCGCTVPSPDLSPIAPGAYGRVPVVYNPAYKKGPIQEQVTIQFRDKSFLPMFFKAEVVPYLHPIEEDRPYHFGENYYTSHRVLSFGRKAPGQTGDLFFRYGNGSEKEVSLRFELEGEHTDAVRMRREVLMGPNFRDTIHVKFTMPQGMTSRDTIRIRIQPYIDDVPTEGSYNLIATGK